MTPWRWCEATDPIGGGQLEKRRRRVNLFIGSAVVLFFWRGAGTPSGHVSPHELPVLGQCRAGPVRQRWLMKGRRTRPDTDSCPPVPAQVSAVSQPCVRCVREPCPAPFLCSVPRPLPHLEPRCTSPTLSS